MSTKRKYKLVKSANSQLFQIVALIEIRNGVGIVCKGDKGGFVSGPDNLSQDGDCWIWGEASVTDSAWVSGNAVITGAARVRDNACISGDAVISDQAEVSGSAYVHGSVHVGGCAVVGDHAEVCGCAWVLDRAKVLQQARVSGNADVSGDAIIRDHATVTDRASVRGRSVPSGNIKVRGAAGVPDGAKLRKSTDILTLTGVFPHSITVARGDLVRIGCTSGTLAWFKDNAKRLARYQHYSRAQVKAVTAYVEAMAETIRKPPRAYACRD